MTRTTWKSVFLFSFFLFFFFQCLAVTCAYLDKDKRLSSSMQIYSAWVFSCEWFLPGLMESLLYTWNIQVIFNFPLKKKKIKITLVAGIQQRQGESRILNACIVCVRACVCMDMIMCHNNVGNVWRWRWKILKTPEMQQKNTTNDSLIAYP